jgi:hypothetical protein
LRLNEVNAAGTLMLGLLVGGTRPILTQSQAFDNRYLLDVLERQDGDSRGFLSLVRAGALQVRFHDSPLLLPAENRFTLVNAFSSALVRKGDFVLSGWPELDHDHPLREELARLLSGLRPTSGFPEGPEERVLSDVDDIAGSSVARRVKGLLLFSRAIAAAGPPALTVAQAAGVYRASIIEMLRALDSRRTDAAETIEWLMRHTPEFGGRSSDLEPPSLDTRSSWIQLIDLYRNSHPESAPVLDAIQDQINFANHRHIARSLMSTGGEVDVDNPVDAGPVAATLGGDNIPVNRLIALSKDEARMQWMTWAGLPALWEEVQDNTVGPADRLEYLIRRHKERIFADRLAGTELTQISVAVSLPITSAAITAGTIDNYLSDTVPGIAGAATGAVVGTLLLLAGSRRALRGAGIVQDHLRRKSDEKWEASVSTGTASWQDEIGV